VQDPGTDASARRAAKAIDQYVELRNKPEATEPDARLVAIVERMFERCERSDAATGALSGRPA
jgi:hypothetical protein